MRGGTGEEVWVGDGSVVGVVVEGGGGGGNGWGGREGEMAGVWPGRGLFAVVKGG